MNTNTIKVMTGGFIPAILLNIPLYAWVYQAHIPWANSFPLGLLGGGMGYMSTFFHEIGHTIAMWFYGYPTLPMFDFAHGGGLALAVDGQQWIIILCVYAALLYGIYRFQNNRAIQIFCAALIALNLAFVFTDHHWSVADFMGPAAVPIIAAFFLLRALFDLAPRGGLERFLNALFGFGMIFHTLIDSFGLLQNNVHRMMYYQQKGQHGFGDFDKIAMRTNFLDFNGVVYLYIALTFACFIAPFVIYALRKNQDTRPEHL